MGSPPPHDPLSEEMDLITWQEAAARLHDESLVVESGIRDLTAKPDVADQEELAALTKRLEALRRVEQRLRSQRPANSVDRTPTLPS
jgi:polyhydroxyalkanoate synthesis regulator phasin